MLLFLFKLHSGGSVLGKSGKFGSAGELYLCPRIRSESQGFPRNPIGQDYVPRPHPLQRRLAKCAGQSKIHRTKWPITDQDSPPYWVHCCGKQNHSPLIQKRSLPVTSQQPSWPTASRAAHSRYVGMDCI